MGRIAVLGGGVAGLSAAYDLSKAGLGTVEVFESTHLLGGLASGFYSDGWEWPLERAYHHIFSSDKHIIAFLEELGYDGILFSTPSTASMYKGKGGWRSYPIDGPAELLRFPLLGMVDKIRAGAVIAALKVSPFLPYYETQTTEDFLVRWMGHTAYETIFGEMFRKKFGKYAENVLASFIWSRVHMRTKRLGYMSGGFQGMVEHVADRCIDKGVEIHTNTPIHKILRDTGDGLRLVYGENHQSDVFDYVITTLPTPVMCNISTGVLTEGEISSMRQIKHLSAVNLILETQDPVFDREYWVSVCTPTIPALVFVQHTNFVNTLHYGGNHILYIASYCEPTDPRMHMSKEDMTALYLPVLREISNNSPQIKSSYLWKAQYAQPIFDRDFLQHLPKVRSSHPRLLFANLDMTYPYDRGTNYAVKLGREAASLVIQSLGR